MRIDLAELKHAGGEAVEYRFEEDLAIFPGDFSGGKLLVTIKASYLKGQVLIRGSLKAQNLSVCSRCLEQFQNTVQADFSEIFVIKPGTGGEGNENRLCLEAANQLTTYADYLYLNEYIRQQIILALEHSPLCKEDCQGLCPQCGTNLNKTSCRCEDTVSDLDLRLLKLKELKF